MSPCKIFGKIPPMANKTRTERNMRDYARELFPEDQWAIWAKYPLRTPRIASTAIEWKKLSWVYIPSRMPLESILEPLTVSEILPVLQELEAASRMLKVAQIPLVVTKEYYGRVYGFWTLDGTPGETVKERIEKEWKIQNLKL